VSVFSVRRNMLRSFLTILGIVIDVSTREIGLRLAVGALEGEVLLSS
jgi:hypothetical protein